jgi:hypothetical protein
MLCCDHDAALMCGSVLQKASSTGVASQQQCDAVEQAVVVHRLLEAHLCCPHVSDHELLLLLHLLNHRPDVTVLLVNLGLKHSTAQHSTAQHSTAQHSQLHKCGMPQNNPVRVG